MGVSAEQFKTISDIAGLEIERDDCEEVTELKNKKVILTVYNNLELEQVMEWEEVAEGLRLGTLHAADLSDGQLLDVVLVGTKTEPQVTLSLQDPLVTFLPKSKEVQEHSFYEQAIITDGKKRMVIFDRGGGVLVSSPGLPKDFQR